MMQKIETYSEADALLSATRTLSLEALRSFVAICETGSFRRAAERTHKSYSAVSLQIGKLEELLGARLLYRDARHVRLTEQGELLLSVARRMLGLNDEAFALFRTGALSGRLRLLAPHDLGVSLVPRLLQRLAEVHPGIHVDVRLGTFETVTSGMREGSANVALFNDVGPSELPARDLFSEPLQWLMCNGGRAAEREPLPLALAETGCAWRDAAVAALAKSGLSYHAAYSSDTSMGQMAALRADLAIAALPRSLADRDLVEVPGHYGLPDLPLTHIRIADDGSDLALAFSSLVVDAMQSLPAIAKG
ncbi:LysR family transcriptional regulator [Martelella mangrovi]|uniref:DNA-binding transcriptional LysR family regulator n=1 Tax=Martelella mangrovi TaxID=1397477 RepID=A0ABV2IA43_9HYPH